MFFDSQGPSVTPNGSQVVLSEDHLSKKLLSNDRDLPEEAVSKCDGDEYVERRIQLQRTAEKESTKADVVSSSVFREEQIGDKESAKDEEEIDTPTADGGPDGVSRNVNSHHEQDGNATEDVKLENSFGSHLMEIGSLWAELYGGIV